MKVQLANTEVVKFVRWFRDPEIWVNVAGLVTVTTPLLLTNIGVLDLSPKMSLWVTLGLTGLTYGANLLLKRYNKTIVAGPQKLAELQERLPDTGSDQAGQHIASVEPAKK